MLELSVLIIGIVLILLFIYIYDSTSLQSSTEQFENFYLSSCPSGYKSFYDAKGNIVCCDGDIMANKCLSDNQCTLNGKGTPDMPNCTDLIQRMYLDKSKEFCSSSLPNYFEDRAKNIRGCMSGSLNNTMTGPKNFKQHTCYIFPEFEKNFNFINSCSNQRQLDSTPCFGNNCTKELVQPNPNAPPLVAIGFTDSSGMHRVAYTKQSMENFLNVTNPQWQNQGIELTKNINVAEVAKAFYIDKTMNQSEIQF